MLVGDSNSHGFQLQSYDKEYVNLYLYLYEEFNLLVLKKDNLRNVKNKSYLP